MMKTKIKSWEYSLVDYILYCRQRTFFFYTTHKHAETTKFGCMSIECVNVFRARENACKCLHSHGMHGICVFYAADHVSFDRQRFYCIVDSLMSLPSRRFLKAVASVGDYAIVGPYRDASSPLWIVTLAKALTHQG